MKDIILNNARYIELLKRKAFVISFFAFIAGSMTIEGYSFSVLFWPFFGAFLANVFIFLKGEEGYPYHGFVLLTIYLFVIIFCGLDSSDYVFAGGFMLFISLIQLFFALRVARYLNCSEKFPDLIHKNFFSYILYPNNSKGFSQNSNAIEAIKVIVEARKGSVKVAGALRLIIDNMEGIKSRSELNGMTLKEFRSFVLKTDLDITAKDFDGFFDMKMS